MMQKINESCFKKCTGKSGVKLDLREQDCLSKCMDRYMETMNVVSKDVNSHHA